jgi:hypothetical protein
MSYGQPHAKEITAQTIMLLRNLGVERIDSSFSGGGGDGSYHGSDRVEGAPLVQRLSASEIEACFSEYQRASAVLGLPVLARPVSPHDATLIVAATVADIGAAYFHTVLRHEFDDGWRRDGGGYGTMALIAHESPKDTSAPGGAAVWSIDLFDEGEETPEHEEQPETDYDERVDCSLTGKIEIPPEALWESEPRPGPEPGDKAVHLETAALKKAAIVAPQLA